MFYLRSEYVNQLINIGSTIIFWCLRYNKEGSFAILIPDLTFKTLLRRNLAREEKEYVTGSIIASFLPRITGKWLHSSPMREK